MRVDLCFEAFDAGMRGTEPLKLGLEHNNFFVRHRQRGGGVRGLVLDRRAVALRRVERTRRSRDLRFGTRKPRPEVLDAGALSNELRLQGNSK